jgi:hypothetical protein
MDLRTKLLEASRLHFHAHIEKHRMNIETLLAHPRVLPEHVDIMETIEGELAKMADYHDKLEMLNVYFKD